MVDTGTEHIKRMTDEQRIMSGMDDLLYTAWTIIANAYEGDWDKATPEWHEAAVRWRNQWHTYLEAV